MQRVDGRGNGPAPDMCIRGGHPITTFAFKDNYWGGESITKFLLKDMYAAAGHPIKQCCLKGNYVGAGHPITKVVLNDNYVRAKHLNQGVDPGHIEACHQRVKIGKSEIELSRPANI